MLKTYRENVTLSTRDCDFTSSWRPSALLEALQETAGAHSSLLGAGRHELLRMDIAWVLTRLEIVMYRYPKLGETVSVETFPMPARRWFFPRYFVLTDAKGDQVGCAGSLWVLMDLKTRHMVKPDAVLCLMPDNSDLMAPLGLPGPVNEVGGTITEGSLEPVYSDLDANGHVNNARYMDWCCNALGLDTLRQMELSRFAVNYDNECLPGQSVQTRLCRLAESFSFSGFRDGTRCFDIGGELRPR